MSRLVLGLAALLLLVGCAWFGGGEPLDEAAYQVGYGQGCNTGQHRRAPFSDYVDRDATRYAQDRSYRAGWNAGYNACSRPLTDAQRGSLPSPVPGGGPQP